MGVGPTDVMPRTGNLMGDIEGVRGERRQRPALDAHVNNALSCQIRSRSFWQSSRTEAQTSLSNQDLVPAAQCLPADALPIDKGAIDAVKVENHINTLL